MAEKACVALMTRPQLEPAMRHAANEAERAFGSGEVYLERSLNARAISKCKF